MINNLPQLNLPDFQPKIKNSGDKPKIYDPVRKKYVVLTPEEWVRQNFLNYLIEYNRYPSSRFRVETEISLDAVKKRCDIVFYNKKLEPRIIVECKAPGVRLSQEVMDQAARYNLALKVDLLIITNGLQHIICKLDFEKMDYSFLDSVPTYI